MQVAAVQPSNECTALVGAESGAALEVDIASCATGDAVLPLGETDNLKAKFVRKHDDGTVTFHASRHAAYRGEQPVDSFWPGRVLSQLEVADAWRLFIYGRQVCPRSMTDIRGTVSTVIWHTIAGLLFGMIPAIGILPLLHLTYTYAVRNYHLFGGPPHPHRIGRIRQRILYGLALYVMVYQCAVPLMQYRNWTNVYQELHSAGQDDRRGKLQALLMLMQLDGVSLLCSISSLFLVRILAVNTMQVYSDIAYYKALAEGHLPKRSSSILNEFKHRFTEIYEPFSAPVRINDEYFYERIGWWRQSLAIFSACAMFLGLTTWYVDLVKQAHTQLSLPALTSHVFSAVIVGQNWYMLTVRLFGVVVKLKRNAKQLLLFRTLNVNQDFASWDTASKSMLREMLQARLERVCKTEHLTDVMKVFDRVPDAQETSRARSFKASIFSSDFKDFESWLMQNSLGSGSGMVAAVPDRFISHLVTKLIYGAKAHENQITQFSLYRAEDATHWWNLRQFLLLDFADESCLVDFSITVTLLLLGCFSCIGFMDWTAHKEVITSQMGKVISEVGHQQCWMQLLVFLCPIAGLVLAVTTIATLSVLFFELAQSCVDINRLLDDDAKMLRDTLVELQVQGSVGDGPAAEKTEAPATLWPLLSSMLQAMQDTDQKQKLFGFVVDGKMQQTLIFSVLTVVVSFVWKQFGTIAMDLNMDRINNATSILID